MAEEGVEYNVNKIYIEGFTNRQGGRGASVAEAKNFFKNLRETNSGAYDALKRAAAARGLPTDHKSLVKIMDAAVDWTQTINNPLRAQPNGIDPGAYLDYIRPGSIDLGEPKGPKYGTSKQITEQTTQYSPSSGAQTISDTMEEELGRTASAAEIAAGTTGLNAAAMKNFLKLVSGLLTDPNAIGQVVSDGR